jgi:hypothetical protein
VKEKHFENLAVDKCQFCDQAFKSKRELQHHQRGKGGGKLVGCAVVNASDPWFESSTTKHSTKHSKHSKPMNGQPPLLRLM